MIEGAIPTVLQYLLKAVDQSSGFCSKYIRTLSNKHRKFKKGFYLKSTAKLYIPIPHVPWRVPGCGVPRSITSSPVCDKIF